MAFTFGSAPTRKRCWDVHRPHAARYWTAAQVDLLCEQYGSVPVGQIAAQLGKSPNAVHVKAKRLGLGARDGFLTARQVAEILGVDSHTPCRWAVRGLLPMRETDTLTAHGSAYLWACDLEDLERFIARHPEMYDWRRIPLEPWRTMGQRAHAKADFLTVDEAAIALSVSERMVRQHVHRGWLPAVHGPKQDRGGRPRILIRRRDLRLFRPRVPGLVGHPSYRRRKAA